MIPTIPHDLLFELRYAVRVLERQARFWRRVDALIRFAGLLSGTAAFAAITQGRQDWTLVLGLLFAIFQALEYTVHPASKAAEAQEESKRYDAILAEQLRAPTDELRQRLLDTRSQDPVTCFEGLRRLAYNDVAAEIGQPEAGIRLSRLDRLQGLIA